MGRLGELLQEVHATMGIAQGSMLVGPGGAAQRGAGGSSSEGQAWSQLVSLVADVLLDVNEELGGLQQAVQEAAGRVQLAGQLARQQEGAGVQE
jgi:hypothetical protein